MGFWDLTKIILKFVKISGSKNEIGKPIDSSNNHPAHDRQRIPRVHSAGGGGHNYCTTGEQMRSTCSTHAHRYESYGNDEIHAQLLFVLYD
jgi:hypothetical protein